MQNRSRVINRLALVLLSIVVLELVLIGDRVQPVKAIKKKILIKKLKKMLPLLALIKPKKKIILLPIPIPMFNKHGQQYPQGTYGGGQMQPFMPNNGGGGGGGGFVGSTGPQPPSSFMMMTGEPVNMDAGQLPMTMNMVPYDSTPMFTAQPSANMSTSADSPQPVAMMMPSMTMTIQSEPGGGSNIELSTGPMNQMGRANGSLPLIQSPGGLKYSQQQQQPQFNDNQFDDFGPLTFNEPVGGEQYYSSPWGQRSPLASPAKLLRSRPQQQQQPVASQQRAPPAATTTTTSTTLRPTAYHQQSFNMMTTRPPATSGRLQQRAQPQPQAQPQMQMPLLVINQNQWRPSGRQSLNRQQQQIQYREPQQQLNNNPALEFEELVPIGPPQVMPIYQTPNGQLHLTPPPSQQQQQVAPPPPPPPTRPPSQNSNLMAPPQQQQPNDNFADQEDPTARPVDLNTNNQNSNGFLPMGHHQEPTSQPAARLSSPSIKGKQLQASGRRKTQISGGY